MYDRLNRTVLLDNSCFKAPPTLPLYQHNTVPAQAEISAKRTYKKDYGKDFSDHPRIQMPFGNTTSSAAGAYQVMGYTWDDPQMIAKRKKYGITSFDKLAQDHFAIVLLKHKRGSAWPYLLKGEIQKALELEIGTYGYSHEWASLPPGRYGQPAKTMTQALKYYNEFLEKEMNGETDLHIAHGFLQGKFK